jgi:hypothetical protein
MPALFRAALLATAALLAAGGVFAQEPERLPADSIPLPPAAAPDTTEPGPDLETDFEEPGTWIFETSGFRGFTLDHYNRVDGAAPAWGFAFEPVDPSRRPTLAAMVAVATTHERVQWSVSARQRLPLPGALVLRFEHFHRAATFDGWKISSRENDVTSVVAASDRLDWWREKGLEIALDAESPGGLVGGTLAFTRSDQHAEPNRSPFALFGDDEDWRDNPPIEEGRLRAVRMEGWLDTRDVQSPLLPAPGWSVRGTWELTGGALGGDLAFSRASLDVRRYTRLARDAWWDSRLVWMGPLGEDDLPPQREVKLGGPGSLRGFRPASLVGDAGVQAQTELRLPLPVTDRIAIVFLYWYVVGFLDAGAVAIDGEWSDLRADVGAGISGVNIFSYIGFFAARPVTSVEGDDDGVKFIVRLRRDF